MLDLFDSTPLGQPLASRMRPTCLDEYVGQSHLLGPESPLRAAIKTDRLHSMILWGPPGCGKTSLAQLIANETEASFVAVSAILSGVKEIRQAIEQAKQHLSMGRRTLLFVDEVHRFNKAQQDAFLPFVEDGTVIFVGATTENPSFELNNALLSRCRVYRLTQLSESELNQLIDLALNDSKRGLGEQKFSLEAQAREWLIKSVGGDSRQLLNYLEIASDFVNSGSENIIRCEHIKQVVGEKIRHFDKGGDYFYEQISALHKSVRGSDPDAALYWLLRMLDGGCDPIYVARRLVRMASEDIGNADPRALSLTINAWDVQQRLGSPEGELALAQATLYLACAAKSNAVYQAYNAAKKAVKDDLGYEVPLHLRNASSGLMKSLKYGQAYRYSHDEPEAFSAGQSYWPEKMSPVCFYAPVDRGLEIQIQEKLNYLKTRNRERGGIDL